MSSPCLGDEFSLGDGNRIELNICGEPVPRDWPFDCPPSVGNGLRRESDGCLWTTPNSPGFASGDVASASCPFSCSISPYKHGFVDPLVTLAVTNTDTCRPITLLATTTYKYIADGSSSSPPIVRCWRKVTGVDGGDGGWVLVSADSAPSATEHEWWGSDSWVVRRVEPGETNEIRLSVRMNTSTGFATLDSIEGRIGLLWAPTF